MRHARVAATAATSSQVSEAPRGMKAHHVVAAVLREHPVEDERMDMDVEIQRDNDPI